MAAAGPVFCVTDTAVGGAVCRAAGAAGRRASRSSPGEGAKTMAEAERVLRDLARAGMTREDHVVALGGGVVGDLAGFCAHLYQRGVRSFRCRPRSSPRSTPPTAARPGSTCREGKNYAGAYHLPAAVIADTATLASCRPRSWRPASSSC